MAANGGAFFKQKALGLPVWGWGLIVGGAGLYYWYRKKQAAAAAASTTGAPGAITTANAPVVPAGSYGTAGSYGGGGGLAGLLSQQYALGQQAGAAGIPGTISNVPTTTTATNSYPGYAGLSTNVAQTVQNDLTSGTPVYYSAAPGTPLIQVTQPTPGGQWLFGGSPNAPGNASGAPGQPSQYYVASGG